MKIAVLGSGGREHAIFRKLSMETNPDDIYAIPGNGGIKNCVKIDPLDFRAIKSFCTENQIRLIIVGPEAPLANGIVDFFKGSDIMVFGPDRDAAQLEASKIRAKRFMKTYIVATADFVEFPDGEGFESFVDAWQGDLVVKFDGLAAGKGVYVCSSVAESRRSIEHLKANYGKAAPFLIERKLTGREISIIGFTDGRDIQLFLPSQDHKPVYDGDRGPNTGGMGAYCPVPFCNQALLDDIKKEIIDPTLRGIREEKLNYRGAIYFGLMITAQGPKLLEYNVRLGDPETEVILPALKSSLLQLILSCLNGTLQDTPLEFNDGYFVDVVMASGGYPGNYETGFEIQGLAELHADAMVFHAGTREMDGKIVTSGGRVLNIVAKAGELKDAIKAVYAEVGKIYFKNMYYRKDIGVKGLEA